VASRCSLAVHTERGATLSPMSALTAWEDKSLQQRQNPHAYAMCADVFWSSL
jgi:hypothetical protein